MDFKFGDYDLLEQTDRKPIIHLVIAQENSEAGQRFNNFAFEYLETYINTYNVRGEYVNFPQNFASYFLQILNE